MNDISSRSCFGRTALVGSALALAMMLPARANAQDRIIREPGNHPDYPIEVEPHATFGWDNIYGSTGVGAGIRLSIPIIKNGFVTTANDNVAISFGGDFLHYERCYYGDRCGANYLMAPVAMQWNFFVARRWSLGPEAGAFLYKGFFDDCGPGPGPGCMAPSSFGVRPTASLIARYSFSDHVALALRAGYPTISVGLSFL